jgi:rhamnosyltransferase
MILPDKHNTCIVVVSYNPDSSFVINLAQHLKIANKIFIIDNNSDKDIDSLIPSDFLNNIVVIKSKTNKGIAWALNIGIKEAILLDYKWVLTFDQDSFPNNNLLYYYSEVIKKVENIGLIGTKYSLNKSDISEVTFDKTLTVITSGTLHPLNIFDKVGLYNEKLFIDNVDFDFTLRVRLANLNVLRIREPLIQHKLGTPIKRYGIESPNHNITRRYYYARNHIFLTKKYFLKFPFWIAKKNFFFIKSILVLIIVENEVIEKLRVIYKGIKDGFENF